MDAARIRAFCAERGIRPVEVRSVDFGKSVFKDGDGKPFFEVETNFWASEPEASNEVVYLHSNLHHGGILLRPTYLKIDGRWYNALNGAPAPAGLPYKAQGSAFQKAIGGSDKTDRTDRTDRTVAVRADAKAPASDPR